MNFFAHALLFAICATLASTTLSQAIPPAKCAEPDFNNEKSIEFGVLREQYVLDGILLEKCAVLKLLETDPEAKCKYNEADLRQQPPKYNLLKGLAGTAETQSWYAQYAGYGYLKCQDGDEAFDIDVKII